MNSTTANSADRARGVGKMMPLAGTIVEPFPDPPTLVAAAIDELQLAALTPPEDPADLRRVAELPRPWDPATCGPMLREAVWTWLTEVAAWINEQHLWNTTRPGIPPCWPAHPHLAHDLAVIACIRCFSSYAATPNSLDEWHRCTLPMFLDRIRDRAGDCCQGGHQTRPRQARDQENQKPSWRAGRRQRVRSDSQRLDWLAGPTRDVDPAPLGARGSPDPGSRPSSMRTAGTQ